MKSFFPILVIGLCSLPLFAQVIINSSVVRKIPIEGKPSFFFKAHPRGEYISYTLPKNTNNPSSVGINHLLDVKSLNDIIIPGPWDPVFAGATGLMVLPSGSGSSVKYYFYELDQLIKSRVQSSPLSEKLDIAGLYQSTGVLFSQGRNYSRIRVIAEGLGSHSMQDFEYDKSIKLIRKVSNALPLCPSFSIKLPMLSKNGRFLGALDRKTNTSAVFEIADDGKCTKIYDLGVKTGKINFSADNSKVTYHLYNSAVIPLTSDASTSNDLSNTFIAIPNGNYVGDIFVMELSTKKITRITTNKKSNSLYPDFLENGNLIFINHPHEESERVNFVIVNINASRGPASTVPALSIIKNRCLSCHSSQHPSGGVDLESRLLDFVTPGNPEDSLLIQMVMANAMPIGKPLSASEKKILVDWVREGAKTDQ